MKLGELEGKGWLVVEPPEPMDEPSVVARYRGEPIKAGFRTERVTDTNEEIHYRYRSGRYDLDVKIDFTVGRGQIRVTRAPGYESPEASAD